MPLHVVVRIEYRPVVGAPSYFADHPKPKTPHDLTQHRCIKLRLQTLGRLYAWEFDQAGREPRIRVDGPFILNEIRMVMTAAWRAPGWRSF
jgi:hypothetical protein